MNGNSMNPFLPPDEYIPDGEPHVFGDRVYLFGSHDREGGSRYCEEGNYVGWSAPVNDISDWRYEGVLYQANQDPDFIEGQNNDLYAPDVVCGNDGRYYLYYNLERGGETGVWSQISVAVCGEPAGQYEYYGKLRLPDGTLFQRYLPGDPAVLNDDGVIRLYYGWSLSLVAAWAHTGQGAPDHEAKDIPHEQLYPVEQMIFKRSLEELRKEPLCLMGANTVVIGDDMLTVSEEPRRIVPGQFQALNTGYEGHAFYEASSIRKINGMYYFIYSSQESHELCYATSRYPDRDFQYRGVIISNGDVGFHGRAEEDRLNMTANNHGSIEQINGQWYVFYHRHTHSSTFSRQACAEPIILDSDGGIAQVECTSHGLNGEPLIPKGEFSAVYACNITNGHMPHATNRAVHTDMPYITHCGDQRYITNIKDGCRIGFKYFTFEGVLRLGVTVRGSGSGKFIIDGIDQNNFEIAFDAGELWHTYRTNITCKGAFALYLQYSGSGSSDLLSIRFDG